MLCDDRTPAISIRQPWAWAILHAGKTIENREWRSCKYRGPVWIHASLWGGPIARLSLDASNAMIDMATTAKSPRINAGPITLRQLFEHRGGIVGRANIVGVVERELSAWSVREPDGFRNLTDEERAWWIGGFGLVLADAEPVPFVPCKGKLGLFQVDDVTRAALAKAVR